MAELVVTGTLVGVRQHVVGFCCLLEFLLGLLVARILVRVILNGSLAVGLLYFVGVSVLLDAQHFVVIPLSAIFSLSYNDFCKTQHLVAQHVAGLDDVYDLALHILSGGELGHGLA